MKRGEAREAVESARGLGDILHRLDDAAVEKLRAAFLSLLRVRGYFVTTPEDVAASLREIKNVGRGFDLFDLLDALGATNVLFDRPKEKSHGT